MNFYPYFRYFLSAVGELRYKRSLLTPLNAELNPICHLLALLGGATIVVVSRLRVNAVKHLSVT
jgi:hypothetical protein